MVETMRKQTQVKGRKPTTNADRNRCRQPKSSSRDPRGSKKPKKLPRHKLQLVDEHAVARSLLTQELRRVHGVDPLSDPLLESIPEPVSRFAYADVAPNRAFDLYQAHVLLKKYVGIPGSDLKSRTAAAFKKWCDAEDLCALTNRRFADGSFFTEGSPLVMRALARARQLVAACLGDVFSLEALSGYKFGPGVALGDFADGRTTPYYKLGALPITATSGAIPFLRLIIARNPTWWCAVYSTAHKVDLMAIPPYECRLRWLKENSALLFTDVDCNTLAFVPKDSRTERPIAIEPAGNIVLQLGLDRFIRARMRTTWNVNLNSQEVNASLAQVGSVGYGWLSPCTMDLSSASDCVAMSLVQYLVPPQWFAYMCDIRTSATAGQQLAVPRRLEKISSMGNGFTFALESLLFYAMTRASTEVAGSDTRICYVHGDDIVVPRAAALLLKEVLSYAGFVVNEDKTFITGEFRESCGKDFLRGTNIRPLYLKEPVTDAQGIFRMLNGIRKKALDLNHDGLLWSYRTLLGFLDRRHACLIGPTTDSDTHIHTTHDLAYELGRAVVPDPLLQKKFEEKGCGADTNTYRTYVRFVESPVDFTVRERKSTSYNQWAFYSQVLYGIAGEPDGSSAGSGTIVRRERTRVRLVPTQIVGSSDRGTDLEIEFDLAVLDWLESHSRTASRP